jgi:outer membrane autotransporter protein
MRFKLALLFTSVSLLAAVSTAHAQIYRVTLLGANEIPPANTPATGASIITLNSATREMRVSANFAGLVAPTTAAHVHCCVVQPANAGVATTVPTFAGFPVGVRAGGWDRVYDTSQAGTWNPAFIAANGGTPATAEAAFAAGVAAGRSYLNIHSTTFPGGEIRGVLVLNSFAANPSLGLQGRSAATALDSLGAGTGALSNALVSLAFLAPADQAAAIGRLSPTPSRGTHAAVTESVSTAFDQMSHRLGGLRNESAGQDSGFWIAANGVSTRQDSQGGFAGYQNDGWGLSAGLDHGLAPGSYVGAAVSYSKSSLDYRDQAAGDHASVKSLQGSLYATQDLGAAYLEAMGGYGRQKYRTNRNTGFGAAAGEFDGSLWGVRVGAGLPLTMAANVTVTPQARLEYDKVKQDGYSELSGGPLGLSVGSRSAERVRGSLGAQADFAPGAAVRPFLRAFWHHNLTNDGLDASAGFAAGGTRFLTLGQSLDKNPYTVGAGVNLHSEGTFSAALTYDGTFSGSYRSHLYQAKARWVF